jgi:hypothetical protein
MIRISIILPYVCNRSGFRVQGSKVQVKRFKGSAFRGSKVAVLNIYYSIRMLSTASSPDLTIKNITSETKPNASSQAELRTLNLSAFENSNLER